MKKFNELIHENLQLNEIHTRIEELKTTLRDLSCDFEGWLTTLKHQLVTAEQIESLALVEAYLVAISDKADNAQLVAHQVNAAVYEFLNARLVDRIIADFAGHYRNPKLVSSFETFQKFDAILDEWYETRPDFDSAPVLIEKLTATLIEDFHLDSYFEISVIKFLNDEIFEMLTQLHLEKKLFVRLVQKRNFEKVAYEKFSSQIFPFLYQTILSSSYFRERMSSAVETLIKAAQILRTKTEGPAPEKTSDKDVERLSKELQLNRAEFRLLQLKVKELEQSQRIKSAQPENAATAESQELLLQKMEELNKKIDDIDQNYSRLKGFERVAVEYPTRMARFELDVEKARKLEKNDAERAEKIEQLEQEHQRLKMRNRTGMVFFTIGNVSVIIIAVVLSLSSGRQSARLEQLEKTNTELVARTTKIEQIETENKSLKVKTAQVETDFDKIIVQNDSLMKALKEASVMIKKQKLK